VRVRARVCARFVCKFASSFDSSSKRHCNARVHYMSVSPASSKSTIVAFCILFVLVLLLLPAAMPESLQSVGLAEASVGMARPKGDKLLYRFLQLDNNLKVSEERSVQLHSGACSTGRGNNALPCEAPMRNNEYIAHGLLPDQAVLVSDATTDKAAAAMDVNVGSLLDPPEFAGIAHFLEHMLFYSSTKYPEGGLQLHYLGRFFDAGGHFVIFLERTREDNREHSNLCEGKHSSTPASNRP